MPARREDMPTFTDLHRNEILDIFATNLSMICKREISETSTASGQSPNNYNNYRKLVNDNLLKLNSNISDMLTESFKGIDSICSKVRECISDFTPPEILETAAIPPIANYTESFADDKDTQQMIEKQKQEHVKYAELTKRYEVYRQRLRAEGGLPLELDPNQFNKNEQEVRTVEGRNGQEAPAVETIVKEGILKQNEPGCELESDANVHQDATQENEELEENAEVDPSKTEEQNTDASKPDNLSEITELPVKENFNIVQPKIPKIKRSISKYKLEKPKNKKRFRRRSLEEYTQAVKKEVDNADFESLQVIIQNLTERIDMLSTETLNEKCEKINKQEQEDNQEYSDAPFKGCTFASFEQNEKEMIDDLFVSTTNSIKELLGAALSKALEAEPVKRGKPRLNLTEVHHRPAFTNLHKKLLLQADTSESFLCLQRLMAKHKVKNSIIDKVFSKLKIPLMVGSSSESLRDEGSNIFEHSDLNLQESEDDQISDLSVKYADSLYFNENNMFKSSKLQLPHQRHRSKKSMSNYPSSGLGMEGNTEKHSPTASLKLNNGQWQSKLKKSSPKLIDGGKSRNKNHFKSGPSSLSMSAPKQRTYKRNSEMPAGGRKHDNKENIFGTLVERNQSLFSLPNTKSSGSSIDVALKSRSTVVRSALNDHTKTAPCEDEHLELTPSIHYDIEGGACFSCSERPACQCGVTNSSNANDDKTADKTKYHWMRPRNDMMRIRGLDYLDILDDLTHKDLLPLRSEYPRKDLVEDEELGLDQNKDIQDTYLWKMMYGKEKNDNIWSHLLQPKVECVDKTCHFYDHQEKEKRMTTPVSLLDLPDKTFRALKQKSKKKTIEKLAPYLFDPKEERNNQSLIVMPVRVHYDNPPMQIIKHNISEEPEMLPCATPKPAKRVKTSKLGPPSMKEVKSERAKWVSPAKSKKRITSVQSTPKTNVRVHKVDDIKKDKQSASKKEANSFMNKPLTAFVPSFDDPQPEPQKLTPQQTAYKKAIMRNLNRLMEIKQKEKREQQKIAAKDLALQQKYLATTNFPHYARPTIQSQNYFQRPAVAQNSDQKIDTEKKHLEANAINAIKKLVDIKSAADQRKSSPRAVDVEAAFSDTKSDYERKMLSYKYGKSVGDKLVSFLNHQPPSPHLVIPPPDLLVPTPPPPAEILNNIPKVGSATGGRFLNPNLMKGDGAKNTSLAAAAYKPTMNHRQVLLHLRGLKKKNSQIQNNIQKTISVIEDKMVDILNAPGNNTSLEAFDVMEKEITKVLGMMKSQGADGAAGNRELLLENNLQDISIELFSKLEKILDSEHSKEATSASETDGKVTVRSSGEGKKKKSRKAADRSSSVTTLLAEEKYRDSQRGTKQKTKKPAQAQSETKLKTHNYMPAEKETITTHENELAMGENVVRNDDDISEHIFDNKEDIDRDQGDQPDTATAVLSDSDLDVILDTNEQIQRLDKLLKELQEGNAIKRDNRVEENDEAVLKRQNATTRLETVLGESRAEEEEDPGDMLESISSRIDAFLESPRSDGSPASARMEELPTESVNRDGNDYYNPLSKDFPYPRWERSSTTDTKADTSLSAPCINHTSSSDSSLSEFPHKEDSSTVSPINETTSSEDEFLTPLRTELNLTSFDDDFLTPPEDLLLARLEEDALSSPDEQMFTPSAGRLDDDPPSPLPEELWTSREELSTPLTEEIMTPPLETPAPLTDEELAPLVRETLAPLESEKLLTDELFAVSNEDLLTPLDEEVSPEEIMLGPLDEIENNTAADSEESTSDISDQMNEIIKKVEKIYAQLNDFQMPIDEQPTIPVFSDEKHVPQVPSDEFLTPFMHAVRDTRSKQAGDTPGACADSLESSPSFCNILHFLDALNDDIGAQTVQEVSFSVTEDGMSLQEPLGTVIRHEVDPVSIEDRPAEEIRPDCSEKSFSSTDSVESPRNVVPPSEDLSAPPGGAGVLVSGTYGKTISVFKNRTTKIEPKFDGYSSTTELFKFVPSEEVLLNFNYTPSFCNLLNFFDALDELDAETAQEVHTARMYRTAYAYSIPSVLHQATIEYPIEYSLPDKHGCLRTSNDAKQKKTVSFYEVKEDRAAQSSFRMVKRTKMSIEQLPRLDDSKTTVPSSSKEHLERPTMSDSASKVEFESSNDGSEMEDSCTFGNTTTPSETVRNTSEISVVEENKCGNDVIVENRPTVSTTSVTVIREYSNRVDLPKNFNAPAYARLVPSKEMLMDFKDNNVVFLKSFYAFMYLLVFTALNMEYKCY